MTDAGARGPTRAVVMGASMAGLVSARVLREHFDEVIVVERDALSERAEGRKGAPQGRHLHALLQRGAQILEDLYPGIRASLLGGGALEVDFSRDLAWHHFGAWKARFASGVTMLAMSRPYLEAEVRRRTFALSGVRCLDDHDLVDLLASADRRRITGVRARPRSGAQEAFDLHADLVVDASGRGSPAPRWLEALGYARPPEDAVAVHVGYATRTFRRDEASALPYKAIYVIGDAPQRRIGAMFPIEGDRWIAVMAGMLRDYPSADLPGFLGFARGLPVDELHRALVGLEPLDDGATYRFPSNLRHRYERLDRVPEGLCAVGDALCSFNPIYGQGMTTAALAALTLGECLRERRGAGIDGLARRYYRRVARVIDVPWRMTTLEDLRSPEVTGARPPLYPLIAGALARIHRATSRDRAVALHFLRAMHMVESPAVLLRPDLLARALVRGGPRARALAAAPTTAAAPGG
ncbi:MAG: hypothetical protein R3B09_06970 [Nannocystaceae bacterium]